MRREAKKRGQVTIFIIVGILIAVGILLVAFLTNRGAEVIRPSDLGPEKFIVGCVRDALDISIAKMMANGGESNMSQTIMYNGTEWNYLCYQADYYLPCYNTHPMMELQIEDEINRDIKEDIEFCFDTMRKDYEDRGFDVEIGETNYSVDLSPGHVELDLMKKVDIKDESGALSFEDFGMKTISPIFDLIRVVRDIVNSESQFCYFESGGYMFFYPIYDIKVTSYDGSRIYRVIERESGEEFKFAVRSCALRLGL